ncbi:hypothetical protein MRX96_041690 [Rhipicephalus microplus]
MFKDCNAGLEIDEERCKVRVAFRERSGTNVFIGEVDPDSFKGPMSRPRLSRGWTVLQVSEDVHIPTCTFCAMYGHGRSSCPHKTEESWAICMKCGGNHQAVVCMVPMEDEAVCCAECPRDGRPAEGHPAGFLGCPLLMERVACLWARTNYGPPKVKERGGFGGGQMVDDRGDEEGSGGKGRTTKYRRRRVTHLIGQEGRQFLDQ